MKMEIQSMSYAGVCVSLEEVLPSSYWRNVCSVSVEQIHVCVDFTVRCSCVGKKKTSVHVK